MATTRGVRIVKDAGHKAPYDIDVFDIETGEKLTDIYQVTFDIARGISTIQITSDAPWVYEGPAEFITTAEAGRPHTGRATRRMLQKLINQHTEAIANIVKQLETIPEGDE